MLDKHPFFIFGLFLIITFGTACSIQEKKQKMPSIKPLDLTTFYIGTYTRPEGHVDGNAKGIYQVQVNETTGEITEKRLVTVLTNPSFLTYSPDKKYLYVVSELAHADEPTGLSLIHI